MTEEYLKNVWIFTAKCYQKAYEVVQDKGETVEKYPQYFPKIEVLQERGQTEFIIFGRAVFSYALYRDENTLKGIGETLNLSHSAVLNYLKKGMVRKRGDGVLHELYIETTRLIEQNFSTRYMYTKELARINAKLEILNREKAILEEKNSALVQL